MAITSSLRTTIGSGPSTTAPIASSGCERHADLAHQDQVERRGKCGGDFGRDRHAAARQGQHDRVFVLERRECVGELAAGVGAIDERHGSLQEPLAGLSGAATRRRDEELLEPAKRKLDHRLHRAGLGKR